MSVSFKEQHLCKCIVKGDIELLIPAMRDYFERGDDMNAHDPMTGDTLMHLLVKHAELYSTPQTVSIVYLFGYVPVDLDAQDIDGNTPLHLVVRKKGAYRIVIALIRCGADPEIKNNDGKTPEDILLTEQPEGWQEMLHWLNKFRPGLYRAVTAENPDKTLIERLLRYWCRLTMVKNGDIIYLKCIAHCKNRQLDLVYLLEKYENSIELVMAMLSGKACTLKCFGQEPNGSIDVNTKDYSYQLQYPNYPEVPQPLLEAVWQTNVMETVDILMTSNPDTTVMYSCDPKSEPKPLFFHLMGKRAPDEPIVIRILKECDMNFRDSNGQTILHEAITNDQSQTIVGHILNLGVNVAARDRHGQTARDLAVTLDKLVYVKLIDDHVMEAVKTCNMPVVESLILTSYNHIADLKDTKGQSVSDLVKRNSSKQLVEMITNIQKTQDHILKLHLLVDKGNLLQVKKMLAARKRLSAALDKCGRNILHRAVLHQHTSLVTFIASEFPATVNIKDNLGRTPYHYCHLFLPDNQVLKHLEQCGGDGTLKDNSGAIPSDYTPTNCQTTNQRMREIREFDLDVFIIETNFEKTFLQAIKKSDMKTIKRLTEGLKEYGGGINRFSKMLFDCLDYSQWNIANYLIQNGFNTDIWKQYEHCSPDNPLCAMMECNHRMTSFSQRVLEVKAKDIHQLLERRKKIKSSVPQKEVLHDNKIKALSHRTLQAH